MFKPYKFISFEDLDHDPFGMLMVGRSFESGSGYRYGFNGKEQDDEINGNGNIYDYCFRIYNSRLGRFLSVDPLYRSFAYLTPFQFSGNRPISSIDLDGLEDIYYNDELVVTTDKNPALEINTSTELVGGYINKFQDKTLNNSNNWAIIEDNQFSLGLGLTKQLSSEEVFEIYDLYNNIPDQFKSNEEEYKSAVIQAIANKYFLGDQDFGRAKALLESNALKNSAGSTVEESKSLFISFVGIKTDNNLPADSPDLTGKKDSQGNDESNLWSLSNALGHEFLAHVGYSVFDNCCDDQAAEHTMLEANDKSHPIKIFWPGTINSTPIDKVPSSPGSENSDAAKIYWQNKAEVTKKQN